MDIITGERNDLEKQDYSLTTSPQKHSHNKEKKEKTL